MTPPHCSPYHRIEPHPLRCDWLEEARIRIIGDIALSDCAKDALNRIIDDLKKDRAKCYRAHSNARKTEPECGACAGPMYLISEKQMRQIQNDCAYPYRTYCGGCEYSRDWGCEISTNDIIDEIIARGPVVQQAPADHELPAYICDEDNLGDIHDILTAAFAGNDLSTLPQRWNQELGIIRSRSLEQHDAALVAQEREKWERERDKETIYKTWHCVKECSCGFQSALAAKNGNPCQFWGCTERLPSLPTSKEREEAIAAQAREDVLDEVRDRCAEKMSERNPSITGVMLYYILSDLRQPGQERDPE